MNVLLGKVRGKDFTVDLDALRRSHLLITGVSGSGKSYRLRCLAETLEAFMPVLVFDPEGEYYTLREQFPYLLFGNEGDAPLSVSTAGMLARKILEWKRSAIFDLSSLDRDQQHEWMATFLASIMSVPRELWSPFAFLIDEAHLWAPEKGEEASPALDKVKNLCSRGRKRGFLVVLATQRITKLSKTAAAELQNVLVGRTTLTGDRERVARQVGITRSAEKTEFFHQLKNLKDHYFYGQGLAIADDLTLISPLKALTTHIRPGEIGIAPPAAPEMIRQFLPNLVSIEEETKIEASTIEELRAQVARLSRQLEAKPGGKVHTSAGATTTVVTVVDGKETEALKAGLAKAHGEIASLRSELQEKCLTFNRISELLQSSVDHSQAPGISHTPVMTIEEAEKFRSRLQHSAMEDAPVEAPGMAVYQKDFEVLPQNGIQVDGGVDRPTIEQKYSGIPGLIDTKAKAIIRVLSSCVAQKVNYVPRSWVSVMAGYVIKNGTMQTKYSALLQMNVLESPYRGTLALGDEIFPLATATYSVIQPMQEMLLNGMVRVFDKPEANILQALFKEDLSRAELAAKIGQPESTLQKRVRNLRGQGLIKEVGQTLQLTLDWYPLWRTQQAVAS